MAALCFGCDTRRVSQCATGLPMKFVKVVGNARRELLVVHNQTSLSVVSIMSPALRSPTILITALVIADARR